MLRKLAVGGFSAVPVKNLGTLAAWCDDWAANTGDARYSIIAGTLHEIDQAWGDQGLPTELISMIEARLREFLGPALAADDRKDGSFIASALRDEIRTLPWDPMDWRAAGWVQ